MTHNTYDDAAFEQWLQSQQAALDEDLAAVLDLDAGLREVLVIAQHADLGADLAETLDLDAGLAAIIPESVPVPPLRRGSLRRGEDSPGVEQLILKEMHITSRWFLRTEMLPRGLERAHQLAVNLLWSYNPRRPIQPVSTLFLDWSSWLVTQVTSFDSLSAATESGFGVGVDFLAAIPHDSRDKGEPIVQLRELWLRQVAHAEALKKKAHVARNKAAHMGSPSIDLEISGLMRDLSEYTETLADTIHALNDFVGVDLRDAGLNRQHLDGLRWSLSTKWPPSWQDEIDRDSVPIGNGVFEVQKGNTRTASFA